MPAALPPDQVCGNNNIRVKIKNRIKGLLNELLFLIRLLYTRALNVPFVCQNQSFLNGMRKLAQPVPVRLP